MNSSFFPTGIDIIFEFYRRFCEITSKSPATDQRVKDALLGLLIEVESTPLKDSFYLMREIYNLMLRLGSSEFLRFYDFVFFICRENGQINISVSRAVMGWRLVLAGKFDLLNQWCEFVEKNQRYNITRDTWNQVLCFSRCVNYNLESYDLQAGWPALIDDFVEHMDKMHSTHLEGGTKTQQGSKRKNDFEASEMCLNWNALTVSKRAKPDNYYCGVFADEHTEFPKLPCAVEICLSNCFAGILSDQPCLQFN